MTCNLLLGGTRYHRRLYCLIPLAALALSATGPRASEPADAARTQQEIRALLGARCLACHSTDKKKGGLDLSRREGALAGGDSGPAVVPGRPGESLLIRRIRAGEMPPKDKLTSAQVATFEEWVRAGAAYSGPPLEAVVKRAGRDWWSLQPIQKPSLPTSPFDGLARTPIDRFLFAELAMHGLRPAGETNRLALLRRVTIDLTGLPPTPEEVEAFLNDRSPTAYERVVDRLLASPAHGERWGRHWLDVVRYGESHGYEQNHLRANAWPYRDYVIRAFNEDKPYDRFVTEQLAGDLVGKGNPAIEPATGFLVAGVHDTVGIQTVEGTLQQRANDLEDMVSTIGAAFVGLTVACAKCHDHKFDPIPQTDYYRLAAVVADVRHAERPLADVRTPQAASAAEEAQRQLRSTQGKLADLDRGARESVLRAQGIGKVRRPAVNVRRNVEDFPEVEARYVRLAVLATREGDEPCLDEIEVYGPSGAENLALAGRGAVASASSLLPGFPIHQIRHLNDGRLGNDWSWIARDRGPAWVQIELPRTERLARVVWSRDGAGDRPRYTDRLVTRYRLEVSTDGKAWREVANGDDRAPSTEAIPLDTLRAALAPDQRRQRQQLEKEIAELSARVQSLAVAQSAYIGQFGAPDPIFRLDRGDVMKRKEPVAPGALSAVPGLGSDLAVDPASGGVGRRLALARWITDPRNPLTARVLVNRVWQYHFGRGIVGSASDFGFNGEKPTHPGLLDWLAADFLEHGQSLKHLHRRIVLSHAYRQSSSATAAGMVRDAGNLLLWRMPLRRMEAEAVRDAALAAAGNLDRRMNGPGFRLFKYRVVNVAIYEPLDEHGPETWRRGVYQQAARAIRDDMMANLDCPECAQRTPRRDVTTTPLQALTLLNGPFLNQQAVFLAERVRREAGEVAADQVRRAFLLAFGRPVLEAERRGAEDLVRDRGLGALCRALLNANEFLYY